MGRDRRGEPDLPPGPSRELVDLFKRLRFARQLSGGQLAVKTGLSVGHVSDVLHGWKAPSPDTAMKLVSALGGGVDEAKLASRLAEELAELNRYERRKARADQDRDLRARQDRGPQATQDRDPHAVQDRDAGGGRARMAGAGQRGPRVLDLSEICLYQVIGLPDQPDRYLATVTGDIRRVRCAEVWVNPENTEMQMARFNEFSVSSIVRYEGAERDDVGRVVQDRIAAELDRKVAGRLPVLPGTAIVTGAGELSRCNVRYLVHVASVRGEPGSGFRQISEIGRCVTNAMTEVDKVVGHPRVRTILFPLLGAGQGRAQPEPTISALAGAAIDYFASTPASSITTIYFLAYTDEELAACERVLSSSRRLAPMKRQ